MRFDATNAPVMAQTTSQSYNESMLFEIEALNSPSEPYTKAAPYVHGLTRRAPFQLGSAKAPSSNPDILALDKVQDSDVSG